MSLPRSREIGDLAAEMSIAVKGMRSAALSILAAHPCNNADLSLRMGIPNVQSYDSFIPWYITSDRIVQTYIVDKDKKKNMMNDAGANATCVEHLAAARAVVREYVAGWPKKAYNAQIGRDLGCNFAGEHGHGGHFSRYFLTSLKNSGDLTSRRDCRRGVIFYAIARYLTPARYCTCTIFLCWIERTKN